MSARPTRAIIDLGNLEANFRSIRRFLGSEPEILCVVKADSYGHGVIPCSKTLEQAGADWLGVALPEEGFDLRDAGLKAPILAMGGFWNGQESAVIEKRITPSLFNLEIAQTLDAEARRRGVTADAFVKIDTGMGRIGIRPEQVPNFAMVLKSLENIRIVGLMTHLSVADDMGQTDFTRSQDRLFQEAADAFKEAGHELRYMSMANSPGAVAHDYTRKNLIRLGGILYGLGGDVLPPSVPAPDLLPVLSLISEIANIKKVPEGTPLGYGRTFVTRRQSIVATIPIGYHDGLPRSLSNRGQVLVRGMRANIVGRVSMDWTIIDVTEIPEVCLGDTVTLIGQDGGDSISAEDIARLTDTISYEITCGIHGRATRTYA